MIYLLDKGRRLGFGRLPRRSLALAADMARGQLVLVRRVIEGGLRLGLGLRQCVRLQAKVASHTL